MTCGAFGQPAFSQSVVRWHSNLGDIDILLFDLEKPATVANFLGYIDRGGFTNSIIHRSVPGFVIQGGGFQLSGNSLKPVHSMEAVINEPGISNLRGTVAMAKLGGNPNSATSQWFVNLADNSANLDAQNGGFTVFGKVLGNGMDTVDAIAALDTYNATLILGDAFGDLPLRSNSLEARNLVLFPRVSRLAEDTVVEEFDFADGWNGFTAGFADLPADYDPALYDLLAEVRPLPANLGGSNALFLSGVNRSDDLWMFVKREMTGLKPRTVYRLTVDLEFASQVSAGLIGAGGSPGESVYVKCGASTAEPLVISDASGWLRMSIDKGQQAQSGTEALGVGNIAKSGPNDGSYALVRRNNRGFSQEVATDSDGKAWIFCGVDSGYEGLTSLFLTKATFLLSPNRPAASEFRTLPGSYVGVFDSGGERGLLTIDLRKNGSWSGSLVINGARNPLRGIFAADATSAVSWGGNSARILLKVESIGLADGQKNAGDHSRIVARLPMNGGTDVLLLPIAEPSAFRSLAGRSVNVLFETQGTSAIDFGYGFARATIGRDGSLKWAGRLADGTPLTGTSRITETWEADLLCPVSIGLPQTKGHLHGEVHVAPPAVPTVGDPELFTTKVLSWIRPANAQGKTYAEGFLEHLAATGRVWQWARGTSALGGNWTCDLHLTQGEGRPSFVLQANWNSSNKPIWSAAPAAFEFRCNPVTGAISGKLPIEASKKAGFQGLLFSIPKPLPDGGQLHGGGYVDGTSNSGSLEILSP